MKYTVECPYCGKNYIVESAHNESFTCLGCGGLGSQSDIIHRDYESDRIHQAARLLLRQHLKDNAAVSDNNASSDLGVKIGVTMFLICIALFFLAGISESIKIHNKVTTKDTLSEAEQAAERAAREEERFIENNTSADAENIRKMLNTLIEATAGKDYEMIVSLINKRDRDEYPWISNEGWIWIYARDCLGKYLGDSDIRLVEATYRADGTHSFTDDKWYSFDVKLSDGFNKLLCFTSLRKDNWSYGEGAWYFDINGYPVKSQRSPMVRQNAAQHYLVLYSSYMTPGQYTITVNVENKTYEESIYITSKGRYFISEEKDSALTNTQEEQEIYQEN